MNKKIFLLVLSLILFGMGCLNEVTEKESKILELVKNGEKTSVISNVCFMTGKFLINKKLSKEQIICSDDKLNIIRLQENQTVISIASKYNEIKNEENIFQIINTDEDLIVELIELLSKESGDESNSQEENILLGDFDKNDTINQLDFVQFEKNYDGIDINYDISPASKGSGNWTNIYSFANPDGEINLKDFQVFANNYGHTKPNSNENILFININFQKEESETPLDYLPDSGLVFSDRKNGYRYGWSSDISESGRDRNHTSSKDQRYDTLLHMKHEEQGFNAYWEIELANGKYSVRVVAGDPEYIDGDYKISVEDQLLIDGTPSSSKKFFDESIKVEVKDGRLTLNTSEESSVTKISFLEIMPENNDSGDTYAPSMVYNMIAKDGDTQAYLSWDNPLYDLEGVIVLTSEAPIEVKPSQGVNYKNVKTVENIKISYIGTGTQQVLTGLENNKIIYIKIFTFDKFFNYSDGVAASASPYKMTGLQNRENSEMAMEELQAGNNPKVVYDIFNSFALTHYGAEYTKELYEKYSYTLESLQDTIWVHISESSAVIAWDTNLPAQTYVEYSEDNSFKIKTRESDRFYYTHLHYLKNLKKDTIYYYRMVSVDERGNTIYSDSKTLRTKTPDNVIYIPGELEGPPYILNQVDKTYILTEDIVSSMGAIHIKASPMILDLNGHKIKYGTNIDSNSSEIKNAIIRDMYPNMDGKLTIINGIIEQSEGDNIIDSDSGANPLHINNQKDFECAALTINFYTPQTYGIYNRYPSGDFDIHHNVFKDSGSSVLDRHGASGARSIYFIYGMKDGNDFKIHDNLISRTRQNGFSTAKYIYDNEIYVDSWSTNSFAIQPYSNYDDTNKVYLEEEGARVYNNKIFLTGYHAIGISWSRYNMYVYNNLIHMESVNTGENRWYESFGDRNSLNGLRLTNYGDGGQERKDLYYHNNTIIGTARHGAEMRGVEFFNDKVIEDLRLDDSIIKIVAEDDDTTQISPIVTQGVHDVPDAVPVIYSNSTFSSNICNIRFGDYYGKGYNHYFFNINFEKIGNNSNYHTFIFDGGYSRDGHILRDCTFEEGTSYNDVFWKRTGDLSSYSIEWTLTLEGKSGTNVEIYDKNENLLEKIDFDNSDTIEIPLKQCTIHPTEWDIDSTGSGVSKTLEHQEITFTPHKIIVKDAQGNKLIEKEVLMDKKQKINLE